MNIVATRLRRLIFAVVALCLFAIVVVKFIPRTEAESAAALVPTITATKSVVDVLGTVDGNADPGDTLEYTITVNNTAAVGAGNDAIGLAVSDTLVGPQTLVPGSPNILPNARNDTYDTIGNTQLQVAATQTINPGVFVNGNVIANDVDFDGTFTIGTLTNAATTQGGTVTLNADGTFLYSPQAGDTAIADTFTYTATDNQGGTDTATVTINILSLVWYVKNDAAAGGDGRSHTPFNTLAGGQAAAGPSTTIYVFNGNGTTSGQNAGTIMEANQRLIGEGVALTVPVIVNGGPNPTTLRVAGTRPMIDNTTGNAVAITNVAGVLVTGLNIGSSNNSAVDVSTSGANATAGAEIAFNTIRSSTTEGIDVNGAGTGTSTLTVSIHDNSITSTGNGIDIVRTAGTLNVTGFDDNAISGNSTAAGINVVGTGGSVLFDADPATAAYNAVSGGNTSIGQSGNGVATSGMVLNNIRGDLSFTDLDIFSDAGPALFIVGTSSNFLATGTGTRVTANANTPSLVATGGAAVDATDTNINLVPTTFSSAITTAIRGVSLLRVSGTLTAPGTITSTNATGTGFFIDGGSTATANVNVTYNGTITADIGRLVQIQNVTAASTHLFTGAITDNNDGDGGETGVSLTGNTAATIRFSGGLLVRTTTSPAFTATGGAAAVEVCDENPCGASGSNGALINTLTSTTGAALNVANTTIGASDLEFQSISKNGAGTGIVLNTTGASGNLKVTGDSGSVNNNSGGTIQNATVGISLTSTRDVVLDQINIHDITQNGIDGFGVTNFSLSNSKVETTGTASIAGDFEVNAIAFVDRSGANDNTITGTVTITGNTITNPERNGIMIETWAGTLSNVTITNNTLSGGTTNARIQDAIHVFAQGTTGGITTGSISNNDISGFRFFDTAPAIDIWIGGNGIRLVNDTNSVNPASVLGTVANPFVITGNDIDNVGSNMIAVTSVGRTASANVNITNNGTNADKMTNAEGLGISLFFGGNGTFNGLVNNNFIDNIDQGLNPSGSSGIGVQSDFGGNTGSGTDVTNSNITVSNNSVSNTAGNGIIATGINNNGTFNLRMVNNTVTTIPDLVARYGIRVQQSNVGTQPRINLEINGNSTAGGNCVFGPPCSGIGIRKQDPNAFGIEGLVPSPATGAQAAAYVTAQNPAGMGTDSIAGSGYVAQNVALNRPDGIEQDNLAEWRLGNSNSAYSGDWRVGSGAFENYFVAHALEMASTSELIQANTVPAPRSEEASVLLVALLDSKIEGLEEPLAEIVADTDTADGGCAIGNEINCEWRPIALLTRFAQMISPTVYAQVKPETGENFTTAAFTLPAQESVTVKFRVTVDNGPYPSAANNITNQATVSWTNPAGSSTTTNISSIALDAAPDLVVTVSDGGGTTQPGGVISYTTTYSNATAVNGQNAGAVRVTQTVPINTTFNATVSGAGWSCPNGSVAGTICTFDVGAVNAGDPPASLNFAVNVLAMLPAGAVNIGDTATIAENPLNANGNDRVPANNVGNDTTNIIGNWDGSNSGDWHLAANWSNDVVPPAGNGISIPLAGNQPVITSADVMVNSLSLGRNVTVNSPRTLSATGNVALAANVIDGTGTLSLGPASAITRTTGQVNATLNKAFAGPGPQFVFPVGTTGQYSPIDVTVTAGAGLLSARATKGTAPATPALDATRMLQRYWTLNGSGITSNIVFHYLPGVPPGGDIPATSTETSYNIFRVSTTTGVASRFAPNGSSVILNAGADTFTLNGLTSYSHWTAGNPLAPTAAQVGVSGRVLTGDGRGVAGARVELTNQSGHTVYAITNPFGFYRFLGVESGQTYIATANHKRYRFSAREVNVSDEVVGFDFLPEP